MQAKQVLSDMKRRKPENSRIGIFLLLFFLTEGIIIGSAFSSRPIVLTKALPSGYVALDFAFLFVNLIIALGAASLILFPSLRYRVSTLVDHFLENKTWLAAVFIGSLLIIFELIQDFLFLKSGLPATYYYESRKLLANKFPGFVLIFLGSFQTLLYIVPLKWGTIQSWIQKMLRGRKVLYFLGLILVFCLLNISGLGFTSRETELAAAQTMNAPILGIQVGFIAVYISLARWIYGWMVKKWPLFGQILTSEIAPILVIWILAIILWNNSPLEPNYFIDIPRAPNYQLYPSSDALKYDVQALDLLNGGGMRPNSLQSGVDFIYHPAHSFFLAVLHAISGDGYQDILFPQIVILSLIPVLLYKLGALIHNRFSGLVISALYIVRERNALFLGRRITVSNSKTLMTEPWAILFFLLFLYLLLLWVKSENRKPWLIISAGGVFGVLVLIRMEVLAMLPVIGLLGLIHFRRKLPIWFRGGGLAGISILLVITPWMIRNYQVEGVFGLDKAYYVRWNINKYLDYLFPDREANEESKIVNKIPYVSFPNASKDTAQTFRSDLDQGLDKHHIQPPARYFLDDFINSIQQTMYYLPDNHEPLFALGSLGALGSASKLSHEEYLEQYVNGLPYWKYDWDGKLIPRSYFPLIFSMGLISYGLSRLKKEEFWIPILFLSLLLTQSAVYAALSGSGGRYIAIVDWIPLVFYGIGLTAVVSKGLLLVSSPSLNFSEDEFSVKTPMIAQVKVNWYSILSIGGVLVAGLILPLSELLIPSPYSEAALETKIDFLQDEYNIHLPTNNKNKEIILYGKALYPRLFRAEDRMEDDRKGTIPDYSYQRVEFYLVGSQNGWVTLPVASELDYFPHGSEVLILADKEKREITPDGQKVHGRYYKAREIIIMDTDRTSKFPTLLVCSGEDCTLDVNH